MAAGGPGAGVINEGRAHEPNNKIPGGVSARFNPRSLRCERNPVSGQTILGQVTATDPEALIAGLNDAQRAAARHFKGPALVVAGAGSGKTRTVVHRIAYLIAKFGVLPNEILAVTFTNKAAEEMRARVGKLLGEVGAQLWVSTFHSAGVRILRMYGERVGLSRGFVIYDDGDQLDLLKDALGSLHVGPDANPRFLRAVVDRAKSNLWTPDDLAREGEEIIAGLPRDIAVEGYRRYQNLLRRSNAVDFNDLLVKCVQLFSEDADVLRKVQSRAAFVHVDEYQDTNHAQYEMARLLASGQENLLVVGDPDQSIYRFRGADIKNILDFQKDYPGAAVYRLEENYRSNARILDLANTLIAANTERLEKTLVAVKPAGEHVKFHKAPDHREEAAFVAMRAEHLAGQGAPYHDMAVLYRTNAQSRVLEERFLRQGVPYRVVGGTSFYERQEIKDILSFARLAINPADDVSLRRALKRPRRGLGDSSVEKLEAFAVREGLPLITAFARAHEALDRGVDKAEDFAKLMTELGEYATEHRAEEFLRLTLDVSGYQEMLKAERSTESAQRLENLEELLVAAREWDDQNEGTIAEFLDDSALLSSVDDARSKRNNKDAPQDAMTFMTMHNAKGLEFPHVFIVGLEEGLLPHRSSLPEPGGIEEERRLFYVAITRAMDSLVISMAESRQLYGRTGRSEPSRFLAELPTEQLEAVNMFFQPYDAAKPDAYRTPPLVTAQIAAAGGPIESFKGGERVRHPKFGPGLVTAVTGPSEKQEAVVKFDAEPGLKRLLVRYANLTRA